MPLPQSLDALKSAAMLKGLDSPVNVAAQFDLPDDASGLPEGLGPGTSGLRLSGTAQPERIAAAIDGGSPALRAAMDQANVTRYREANDINDLASGAPAELARGQGRLKNIALDEQAAGQFMPNVQDVYNRDQKAKEGLYNAQYVIPSQNNLTAEVAKATTDAQGRVAAAQAAHPALDPMTAALHAIQQSYGTGHSVTPESVQQLLAAIGALKAAPASPAR